jgi:hypothetical protein
MCVFAKEFRLNLPDRLFGAVLMGRRPSGDRRRVACHDAMAHSVMLGDRPLARRGGLPKMPSV